MAKKIVGYGLFVLGIARLVFSLAVHSPHFVDFVEALLFTSTGVVLYASDAHKILVSVSQTMYKRVELKGLNAFNSGIAKFFKRLSKVMYENIELRGFDALNYFVANLTTSFSQRFRKVQSGIFSHSMLMVFIGIALLIALLLLFSG